VGAEAMNKPVKAKYPIRIGYILVPKGTPGEILSTPTPRILAAFPNIGKNPNSNQVVVKFPGVAECICHLNQLEFQTDQP